MPQAKPYNLTTTKNIRDLDPIDIDKLVSISGMVTRTSTVIPDLRVGLFQCDLCGDEQRAACMRGILQVTGGAVQGGGGDVLTLVCH